MLALSIVIALVFQYLVAPKFQLGVMQLLDDAWSSGCADVSEDTALQLECSGNSGVYRAASSALLFFILAAIAAWFKPTANREAWAAKIILFLMLNVATMFIPNDPIFSLIMVNIFRIGAVFFIIFQHIVFIDVAHNLNNSWVSRADKADTEEGEGKGQKWLYALIAACVFLFVCSVAVLGFLFKYFGKCGTNVAFISVTLAMGFICTAVQLTGEESSLFESALIFSYSTYLCYVAVSQNPNGECNPMLSKENTLNIILGILLTLLSLSWAGWSHTAHKRIGEKRDGTDDGEEGSSTKDGPVSGIVVRTDNYGSINETNENETSTFSDSWKLNVVLCVITCWYAVALTGWGTVELNGNSANPQVGRVSMWMVACSQWFMQSLFIWVNIAPRLFPDRDFS